VEAAVDAGSSRWNDVGDRATPDRDSNLPSKAHRAQRPTKRTFELAYPHLDHVVTIAAGDHSFWYVECLARAGYLEEAQLGFEKMFTYANHLGLYAEQTGSSR
jgi:hypothetical protein